MTNATIAIGDVHIALASPQSREAFMVRLGTFLNRGLRNAFRDRNRAFAISFEDVTQEALVRITNSLNSFRGESCFTTWAMSIAIRVALSEARRARWRDVPLHAMVQAGAAELAGCEGPADQEDRVDLERLLDLVRTTVARALTEKQRQVIQAQLGGAPVDELASRMNASRNAIYKLSYDARARLKKEILAAGWTEEQVRLLLRRAN